VEAGYGWRVSDARASQQKAPASFDRRRGKYGLNYASIALCAY